MRKQRGAALMQSLGVLLSTLMMGAFAIDTGMYMNANQGMRNAADSAALAAAAELFLNNSLNLSTRMTAARSSAKTFSRQNWGYQLADNEIDFGYIDPLTQQAQASGFTTPSTNPAFSATGGYNAVRVRVKAGQGQTNVAIPAFFAKVLGMNSFTSESGAVALYGGGVGAFSGLRPVYMCRTAWDRATQQYGDPTIPEITFYGDTLQVGTTSISQAQSCGSMGPGNWGLADLANQTGSPGADTVRDWFANGYTGPVSTGRNYEVQTGTPLNSFDTELNTLKTNQTVINIPLYDTTTGNGSNAVFHVTQIASFVITDFKTTGTQSQRYIKGYFKKSICHSNCSLATSIQGGGTTKIRLLN